LPRKYLSELKEGLACRNFFGELAKLGEELLSFDLYVCPKCGEVRFFADEKSMQYLLKLTQKNFLRNVSNMRKIFQ
jgi:hypothetical protein